MNTCSVRKCRKYLKNLQGVSPSISFHTAIKQGTAKFDESVSVYLTFEHILQRTMKFIIVVIFNHSNGIIKALVANDLQL